MQTKKHLLLVSVLVSILVSTSVAAETTRRDPGSAAAAKAQYMLRQVAAERDALKGQNAKLEEEQENLNQKIASLQAKIKTMGSNNKHKSKIIDRYKENNEILRDRIDQQRERMQEVVEKFKEVIANLREVEMQKSQLSTQVKKLDREVRTCAKNNVMLFEAGLEVLDQYKNKGVWDAMSQAEPVSGLSEVAVQNLVQDYRHRMKEQKYYNESIATDNSQ